MAELSQMTHCEDPLFCCFISFAYINISGAERRSTSEIRSIGFLNQEYRLLNKMPVFERLVKYMTPLQLVLLLIKLKRLRQGYSDD